MAWQVQWPPGMPAIDRLMKRLGYVKLSRYGLVLTPEGRVLSMRPASLDDGLGGRIVGWQEGDLAAMELEKWEPARPAPKPAVATRVAVAPRPPVPPAPPAPIIARPVAAPVLAPEPVVEEDDWEWTIAIARARAAADEAELAAAAPLPAPPKFVAAKTLPMAKVAEQKPDPIKADAWPKTEPLGEIDYNDYTSPMNEVVRVARLANTPRAVLPAKATPAKAMPVVVPVVKAPVPAQAREYPRATSPVTVIPVPKLPTVANPNPRRFAKGTGPYLPKTEPVVSGAEPRRDDDTVPGMILPPVLPSVFKRAQRG